MQTPELKMPGAGFSGLFDSWKHWEKGDSETAPVAVVPSWDSDQRGRRGYTCALTRYCSVGGKRHHPSLNVEPSPRVVDYFKSNVLAVPSDTIHFQIIIRDNGTALITMQHNQIIGSHWLDIVALGELPAGVIGGE